MVNLRALYAAQMPLKRERYPGSVLTGDEALTSLEGALESGAGSRVRTRDPLITNQVLYQLSYTGTRARLALRWAAGNGRFARSTNQWCRALGSGLGRQWLNFFSVGAGGARILALLAGRQTACFRGSPDRGRQLCQSGLQWPWRERFSACRLVAVVLTQSSKAALSIGRRSWEFARLERTFIDPSANS